jgi:cytochrome c oxidase assembly protein subunit 15
VVDEPQFNRTLHWLALLTAGATFPLIFMGGLVTSHGAGLAVPDWPNSYGYNMFLFPIRLWNGGIFFEHTHRLMGTAVGFCSILLALNAWGVARTPARRWWLGVASIICLVLTAIVAGAAVGGVGSAEIQKLMPHVAVGFGSLALVFAAGLMARRQEPRRWIRWLTLIVLAAVILQGILGGTRVTQVNLTLAIIHGCFAQAFFCLTAFMCAATSGWWMQVQTRDERGETRERTASGLSSLVSHLPAIRTTFILGLIAVALIYAQLIIAATMRHEKAGLAIPDLPFAYGKLLPPTTATELAAINHYRAWDLNPALDRVTLGQIWLHYAHRVGAIIVSLAVLALVTQVVAKFRRPTKLFAPAVLLVILLFTQLTLGLATVYYRKPADVASLHVAVGALVLMTTFVLTVRAGRILWYRQAPNVAVEPMLSPVQNPNLSHFAAT